ncbi:MAG: hypothetical protein WKG07_05175 [Hymenobacter sp.]
MPDLCPTRASLVARRAAALLPSTYANSYPRGRRAAGLAVCRRVSLILRTFTTFSKTITSTRKTPTTTPSTWCAPYAIRLKREQGLDSLVLNAYADFDRIPTGPQGPLYLMGVSTRNVLGTDHKNAADMQLCIDALEVL